MLVELVKCTFPEGTVLTALPYLNELFAPKEDFAKVPKMVQIIHFPPLNKPNYGRLCHYCATNLNPKSAKMGTKMMCANNCDLHTSLIFNYLELNNALSIHPR